MDFIVFFSLIATIWTRLVISYDICCQWSRNLRTRIPQLPENMRIRPELLNTIEFVIPKFHIYGHGAKCQERYSLNFLRHMAQTNGKEPERWWAHINPISMATKLMGPFARHETIDDHAVAWNWRKISQFGARRPFGSDFRADVCWNFAGPSLLHLFELAITMRAKHTALHDQYKNTFPRDLVAKWDAFIDAWEEDPDAKPNPFHEKDSSMSSYLLLDAA
jgi:hypothetical protein